MKTFRFVALGMACACAAFLFSLSPAAAQTDVWSGTNTNSWDTAGAYPSSYNWNSGSGYYSDGDAVIFNDGAQNTSIAIQSNGVGPASVNFATASGAAYSYSFSGGPIGDNGLTGIPTTVTLAGTGSVTFASANTYSGGTYIGSSSTLTAGYAGALGTGPVYLRGGKLSVTGGIPGLQEAWSNVDWEGGNWNPANFTLYPSVQLSPRAANWTQVINNTPLPTQASYPAPVIYDNTAVMYTGYMYIGQPAGSTVSFFEDFDDTKLLILNNQTLINNTAWNVAQTANWVVPASGAGYYPITLAFGQGGGGAGPNNGYTIGFGYDPNGIGGTTQSNYYFPTDPGNDSVFTSGPGLSNFANDLYVSSGSSTLGVTNSASFNNLNLAGSLHVSGSSGYLSFTGGTISSSPTLNVDGGLVVAIPFLTDNGTSAGAFSKAGSGALVLTGANSFVKGTSFKVSGGSLVAVGQGGGSGPLGSAPIALAGGTLVLAVPAGGPTALTVDLSSSPAGNPLTLSGGNNTIIAGIGAAGSAATIGSVTLTHVNGALTIAAGQGLDLGETDGCTLSLDPGMVFANSGTLSFGPGAFSLAGTSNLLPVGTVSAISGGTLSLGGLLSTGTYAPASGGEVVLSGTYNFSGGTATALAPAVGGTLVLNELHNTAATGGTLNVANGAFLADVATSFGQSSGASAVALELDGGTLGATVPLTGSSAVANPLVWGTTKTLNIGGTSALQLSGSLAFVSSKTNNYIINDPSGMLTLSGSLSGAGALTLIGSPTISVLGNSNSGYTGVMTLGNGSGITSVTIGSPYALGKGTLSFNGGGLEASTPLTGSNAVPNSWGIVPTTTSNILTADFGGSNPFELSGPAALLSGSYYLAVTNPALRLTLSGSISSSAGAHLYVAPGAGGTLVLDNPNNTFGGGTGGLVLQSLGGYVDVNGASSTVTSGSLSKGPLGIGTVTLGSANEGYIGLLNSSATAATLANPLVIYDACTYGSSSGLTLAGAATLSGSGQGTTGNGVMDFLLTPNSNIVFSGLISSAGTQGVNLRQGSGSGGLTLSNTANSYKGNTSITMGTLIAGGNVPYGLPGVFGASTTPITIGDANSGTNAAELVTNGAYDIARGVTVNATAGPTTLGTIFAGVSTYSGAITLNNTNTVGFSAAAGGSVLVTAIISGSGGFTAASPAGGNVSLVGTSNTYTGSTAVSSGQLTLDYNAAGVGSGIVPATSGVVLNGGTLAINGNGSMPVNESFPSTTITGYDSATISITTHNSQPVLISLGTLIRQNQGTMDLASGANGTIIPIAPVNGIAGGFVTVNQRDWLFASGMPSYVPDSSSSAFSSAASNVDVQAGGTPATFGGAANSLRFNSSSAAALNLPGSLTLTTGGILVTPNVGSGASSITGGSLTSSGGTGNQGSDVTVNQFNTTTPFTISSVITNSGTTAIGLTKSGGGKLILTGQNTYTGPTIVGSTGILQIGDGMAGHDASLASSAIVNNSNNPIVFDVYSSQSYGGAISGGSSTSGVAKSGAGTLTLGGYSAYSGPTLIQNGTLKLSNSPPVTAGLVTELDASTLAAGAISSWADLSGNGNNLNQGTGATVLAGAMNGRNVVYFNGTQYMYQTNSDTSTQYTIFAVGSLDNQQNARLISSANNNFIVGWWNGYSNELYPNAWAYQPNSPVNTATHIYCATVSGNNLTSTLYDLSQSLTPLGSGYSNEPDYIGQLELGGYNAALNGNVAQEVSQGSVAEVDIYNGVLSAAQIAQMQTYLQAKWQGIGYENILPATTPVQLAAGATLDLNGAAGQMVASLSDAGGVGSIINSNSGAPAVLALSASGGSTTFSGTIGGAGQGPISLVMGGSGTQFLAGTLSGTGNLTVNAGILVLSGVNPLLGTTTLSGGTLQASNALALEGQTLTLNGGAMNFGSLTSLTLGGLAGTQSWTAPATLNVGGNGLFSTYSGNLSGATSLTVTGPGGLYLSGTNSSLKNVAVDGGVLEVATTAGLPNYATPNAVSVAGGAVLTVPTGDGVSTGWSIGQANSQVNVLVNSASWANNSALGLDTSNGNATYSGNIPISGSSGMGLAKLGANALTLAGSTNFSGPTTVAGGTLNFLATNNAVGALSGSGSVVLNAAPGGTLTISSGNNSVFSGTISEAVQGAGNSLVKTGSGTQTLTGINTYAGNTTINQGVLAAGPAAVGGGALNLAGGTFRPLNSGTTPGLNAQYYYTYAPLSQANNVGAPGNWVHLNTTSLASFTGTYLVANGNTAWGTDVSAFTPTTLSANGADNITADVVNGANGVFSFNTSGEGQNFPYPYNQGSTVYWAAQYTGYFYAPTTGVYTFATNSDDDSRIWINAGQANPDTAIVANGVNGQGWAGAGIVQKTTGTVSLVAGQFYPITVGYDEGNGGYGLDVFCALPGSTLTVGQSGSFLPLSSLFTTLAASFTNSVNVTQTSTIDLLANGGPYSFGPLSVSNGSALHFTSGPANVAFVGGTTISGGPTFDVQNGNVVDVGALVGDNNGFTLSGAGTLILSANASYGGQTTISGGTLQMGTGGFQGTLGNTSKVLDNGTLAFNRGDVGLTFATAISGSGAVVNSGTGLLTLPNNNTYQGGTTVSAGTLVAGSNTSFGSGPLNVASGATAVLNSQQPSVGGLSGGGSLLVGTGAGSTTLTINAANNGIFTGTITEAGYNTVNLVKNGPANLTLTGTNVYGNGTTVNAGTLAAAVSSLGSGPLTLAGGTFQPTLPLASGLTAQYFGPNAANFAHIVSPSLATFNANLPATATYTDNITQDVINGAAGNFDFDTTAEGAQFPNAQGFNPAADNWYAKYTGYFYAPTTGVYTFGLNSDDNSRLWINAGQANPDTAVVVSGTGTGGQGWSGAHGTIQTTGQVTLTGGQYYPITIGYEEGNGGYGLEAFYAPPGATIANNDFLPVSLLSTLGQTALYSNALNVTKNSTINLPSTLGGVSYQFPSLAIGANTLNVTGGTTGCGVAITGTTTLSGVVTFNLASSLTLNLSGGVSGSGPLAVTGSGTLYLPTANTYSGATTLYGGTLVAANGSNGSATGNGLVTISSGVLASDPVLAGTIGGNVVVSSSGQIAPGGIGAIGTLAVNGNLSLNNGSTLDFDVSGGSADLLTVGGTLSVSGIANVAISSLLSLTNTSSPYILAQYAGGTLAQSSFTASGVPRGYQFEVNTSNDDLELDWVGLPASGPAVWTGASNVNWSNNGNWSTGAVPNGKAALAIVGSGFSDVAGQAQTQITLDTAVTLGTLTLSNSLNQHGTGYALTGAALTMDNTGGTAATAQILVTSASHTIAVPVNIGSGSGGTLSIQTATDPNTGNPTGLTITGSIGDQGNGTGVLELSGPGTLVLANTNTYGVSGGGTIVSDGTLIATCSDAIPAATSLSVGAGGVFIYDPSQAPTAGSVVAAGTVAAVPEPGTLTLLAAGLAVACLVWRRRRVAK